MRVRDRIEVRVGVRVGVKVLIGTVRLGRLLSGETSLLAIPCAAVRCLPPLAESVRCLPPLGPPPQ